MQKIDFADSANQLLSMLFRLEKGEPLRDADKQHIMLAVHGLRRLHGTLEGDRLKNDIESWAK